MKRLLAHCLDWFSWPNCSRSCCCNTPSNIRRRIDLDLSLYIYRTMSTTLIWILLLDISKRFSVKPKTKNTFKNFSLLSSFLSRNIYHANIKAISASFAFSSFLELLWERDITPIIELYQLWMLIKVEILSPGQLKHEIQLEIPSA